MKLKNLLVMLLVVFPMATTACGTEHVYALPSPETLAGMARAAKFEGFARVYGKGDLLMFVWERGTGWGMVNMTKGMTVQKFYDVTGGNGVRVGPKVLTQILKEQGWKQLKGPEALPPGFLSVLKNTSDFTSLVKGISNLRPSIPMMIFLTGDNSVQEIVLPKGEDL